ncbi:hypothetical protein GCM10023097_01780 [Streptomyces collinus]
MHAPGAVRVRERSAVCAPGAAGARTQYRVRPVRRVREPSTAVVRQSLSVYVL